MATPNKAIPVAEAKQKVLDYISQGFKVAEACSLVNRAEETYRSWMKVDAEFKAAVQGIRAAKVDLLAGKVEVPEFDVFCRDWLKQPLSLHQLRMWDVIEGREPRDLHDSMGYEPGYPNRVLINVPPDHAKSTTFTINYSVWLIHKNPDVRIIIMSQGKGMAERFLGEIKFKLTSPVYREMHMRFAPLHTDGTRGWKDPDGSWTNSLIYVQGKGGDKDPTVQALGLRGQIYGARSDVIFLDDVITTKNAREIAGQEILLNREIESRLPPDSEGGGLLAILGTRVAPQDLYRHLREVQDGDDARVWTYFRQPAVLDYGDGDSATWSTLWPERYNGRSLARRRRDGNWNLIYQQLDIDDDMTFRAEAVNASIQGLRFPGPMTEDGKGHRPNGMRSLYVVGGLDPATVGNTAMVVVGMDRDTGKRWVLDGFDQAGCSPQLMRDTVKRLTETYGIHEWVIERNAFQKFLTQDPDLNAFLATRGCKLTEHYTTDNKRDSDWGIQTMAPLFESCVEWDDKRKRWAASDRDAHQIELPSPRQNQWVNDLVQQLTIWQPEGMTQKSKTDLVMALWFTHIACSKLLNRKHIKQTHMHSPFLSPAARRRQGVIDLVALRRERQEQRDREATA